MFGIFDPIFREVDRLVKEQVTTARLNRMEKGKKDSLAIKVSLGYYDAGPFADALQAIFLVGGFGSNKCLYDQITKAHPNVQVIQPNDA